MNGATAVVRQPKILPLAQVAYLRQRKQLLVWTTTTATCKENCV